MNPNDTKEFQFTKESWLIMLVGLRNEIEKRKAELKRLEWIEGEMTKGLEE